MPKKFWKLPYNNYLWLLLALLPIALITGLFAVYQTYEHDFMMSVVPEALQVKTISYRQEEAWGFGPGGNEAGIRVYPLPQQIAERISQQRIEFFNDLPPNQGWRGTYEKWSQTPVIANDRWKPKDATTGSLDIYDYICTYGFCIDIDETVLRQATEIINSKGSYYAYGRIGLIVVSPSKKVVLYMYNG
jgi:hypothetical protein